MELRDLSYFLACVDNGSVTRAARQVHAAQPTISHALARLESELGVRVLERGARAPSIGGACRRAGWFGRSRKRLARTAQTVRGAERVCESPATGIGGVCGCLSRRRAIRAHARGREDR